MEDQTLSHKSIIYESSLLPKKRKREDNEFLEKSSGVVVNTLFK